MRRSMVVLAAAVCLVLGTATAADASSQAVPMKLPGGQGTVISNAWRTTGNGNVSGNTRQWDYQVSAQYSGARKVQRIRTTWWGGASIKNSASFSIGVGTSGVTYARGSSWSNTTTPKKYWENTNGAKSSSWRSNMLIAPQQYYLSNTIYIANQALVKVSTDSRTFQINASA